MLCLVGMAIGADSAVARARTVTESASDGSVTARLSYVRTRTRFEDRFSALSLTIERAGSTLLSGPLAEPCDGCALVPANAVFRQGKSIAVQDLDGDGEPEVVFHGYSNGAHCCEVALVYQLAADGKSYMWIAQNFGNAGYRLADLDHDGRPEFVSGDDRFAYTFTAYAFSGLPRQIWRYEAGSFIDVTRSFPHAIAADARWFLKSYRQDRRQRDFDVRGVLAAYVADQYLLGRPARGWALLRTALRRGELQRGVDRRPDGYPAAAVEAIAGWLGEGHGQSFIVGGRQLDAEAEWPSGVIGQAKEYKDLLAHLGDRFAPRMVLVRLREAEGKGADRVGRVLHGARIEARPSGTCAAASSRGAASRARLG